MNVLDVTPYAALVISLFTAASLIKATLTSGEKQIVKEQEAHETKLIEHDRRIQALENEIKHMPDKDATHRLELAMSAMNGRLDTMTEALKPIKATGEMLTELLVAQASERTKV